MYVFTNKNAPVEYILTCATYSLHDWNSLRMILIIILGVCSSTERSLVILWNQGSPRHHDKGILSYRNYNCHLSQVQI